MAEQSGESVRDILVQRVAGVLASGGAIEDEQEAAEQVVDVVAAWFAEQGIVTTDPSEVDVCCGLPRDSAGRCVHRPHHPIAIAAVPDDNDGSPSFLSPPCEEEK